MFDLPLFWMLYFCSFFPVHRAEYEELKAAKDLAEEDTVFSFKRKKGCQLERKQARAPPPPMPPLYPPPTHTHLSTRPPPPWQFAPPHCVRSTRTVQQSVAINPDPSSWLVTQQPKVYVPCSGDAGVVFGGPYFVSQRALLNSARDGVVL